MAKANLVALRALMAAGDWKAAVCLAAQFPHLPEKAKDRILGAREAYRRPEFQRQIGRSIEQLQEAGKAALIEHYSEEQAGG